MTVIFEWLHKICGVTTFPVAPCWCDYIFTEVKPSNGLDEQCLYLLMLVYHMSYLYIC